MVGSNPAVSFRRKGAKSERSEKQAATALNLMRMALALLDESGIQRIAALKLQEAIDVASNAPIARSEDDVPQELIDRMLPPLSGASDSD